MVPLLLEDVLEMKCMQAIQICQKLVFVLNFKTLWSTSKSFQCEPSKMYGYRIQI